MKVKNPLSDLKIFKVSWMHYPKQGNAYYESLTVPIGYKGKNGTVYAWQGFSDEVLAKAAGYGYDKYGVALSLAVTKLTGYEFKTNGSAGVEAIIEEARITNTQIEIII